MMHVLAMERFACVVYETVYMCCLRKDLHVLPMEMFLWKQFTSIAYDSHVICNIHVAHLISEHRNENQNN